MRPATGIARAGGPGRPSRKPAVTLRSNPLRRREARPGALQCCRAGAVNGDEPPAPGGDFVNASGAYGHEFIVELVERSLAAADWREQTGDGGGPRMAFRSAAEPGTPAGMLRVWHARDSSLDRMVHARLLGSPVDTSLFFVFARSDTIVPHFHGQVVQFGPDACVYNADLLPRLDPVDHPGYFDAVFGPITQAYWKATQKPENACASAPGNPAIAAYLSPWSIGAGRPTQRA